MKTVTFPEDFKRGVLAEIDGGLALGSVTLAEALDSGDLMRVGCLIARAWETAKAEAQFTEKEALEEGWPDPDVEPDHVRKAKGREHNLGTGLLRGDGLHEGLYRQWYEIWDASREVCPTCGSKLQHA